jgi:biopolymer transport protein ExbD
MRRRATPSSDLITRVNVTPIIDVALVLVIILLVTAPMITAPDTRIQLPEAHTRVATDERNVSLTLTPEGEVRLDRDVVPRAKLGPALRARLAEPGRENDLVVVCADEGVHYAQVEDLLDQARRAGAKRLAIATRQKRGAR